jgi:hypothetical protein
VAPLKIMLKNRKYLEAFCRLGEKFTLDPEVETALKNCVCEMYVATKCQNVNDARYETFRLRCGTDAYLPPIAR